MAPASSFSEGKRTPAKAVEQNAETLRSDLEVRRLEVDRGHMGGYSEVLRVMRVIGIGIRMGGVLIFLFLRTTIKKIIYIYSYMFHPSMWSHHNNSPRAYFSE